MRRWEEGRGGRRGGGKKEDGEEEQEEEEEEEEEGRRGWEEEEREEGRQAMAGGEWQYIIIDKGGVSRGRKVEKESDDGTPSPWQQMLMWSSANPSIPTERSDKHTNSYFTPSMTPFHLPPHHTYLAGCTTLEEQWIPVNRKVVWWEGPS